MPKTSASDDLRLRDPHLFERLSSLYMVLSTHIRTKYRTGPALASLERLCDLLLTISSDAKLLARIKIADNSGEQIWFGYYPEKKGEPAIEIVQHTRRGEYGTQVSRFHCATAQELLDHGPERLKALFSGYAH